MSQNIPIVSVILPNYNHSQYLKQRIDSVLNQTYQDFELIILDDFSTDTSRDIIKEYESHSKVSNIIYNEKNSGSTFVQWQKGFELASGEYIWIAESDDYAENTFLEKLVGELLQDKTAVIAFSHSQIIDSENEILDQNWDRVRLPNMPKVSHFEGNDFIKARMLFNNSIYNASMVVFKKSALGQISDSYSTLTYSGDWLFWIDVCMQGKVIRYNEKLNYFRQHEQKVTPRAEAKGVRFTEGKIILEHLIKILKLSATQQRVIVGRFIKSLITNKKFESKELKNQVYREITSFFNMGRFSIFVYEIDKRLNFSKLGVQKNRYR